MTPRNPNKITKNDALCVLSVVGHGLVNGVGDPQPGQMCVEAAVAYAFGEPHGDDPRCVDPSLKEQKIELNDADFWSDEAARARGLQRIAIAQLGSAGLFNERDYRDSLARQLNVIRLKLWREENVVKLAILTDKKASPEDVADAISTLDDNWYTTSEPMGVMRLVSKLMEVTGKEEGDEIYGMAANMMVEACIEQKIPGTRFLHLAQSKKRMSLKEIEKHRQRRARGG